MTIIDYRRSALTVIQVASTPAEDVLRFLEDHGQSYTLESRGGAGLPLRFLNSSTGERLTVPCSSYLVWDPDYRTLEIYPSASALRAIGINPDRIISMLSDHEPAWMHFD